MRDPKTGVSEDAPRQVSPATAAPRCSAPAESSRARRPASTSCTAARSAHDPVQGPRCEAPSELLQGVHDPPVVGGQLLVVRGQHAHNPVERGQLPLQALDGIFHLLLQACHLLGGQLPLVLLGQSPLRLVEEERAGPGGALETHGREFVDLRCGRAGGRSGTPSQHRALK